MCTCDWLQWYFDAARCVSFCKDSAAKDAPQLCHFPSHESVYIFLIFFPFLTREGRSNAHVKGDYQRIGDVMLRNMCALKVRS